MFSGLVSAASPMLKNLCNLRATTFPVFFSNMRPLHSLIDQMRHPSSTFLSEIISLDADRSLVLDLERFLQNRNHSWRRWCPPWSSPEILFVLESPLYTLRSWGSMRKLQMWLPSNVLSNKEVLLDPSSWKSRQFLENSVSRFIFPPQLKKYHLSEVWQRCKPEKRPGPGKRPKTSEVVSKTDDLTSESKYH